MKHHSDSAVIRALDLAVAFATLETYGVVDGRPKAGARSPEPLARPDGRRPALRRAAASSRAGTRCPRHERASMAGRPRAATAAGRHRHRSALRKIERLNDRSPRAAGDRTDTEMETGQRQRGSRATA